MTITTSTPVAVAAGDLGMISRVVVGVDDSPPGIAAVAAAMKLARSSGAPLVAVRAWALGLPRHGGRRMRHLSHPHVVISFCGIEQRTAASVLAHQVFGAAVGGMPADVQVTIRTPDCDPAVALVGMATEPGDVIVVGRRRGHPLSRVVHGSVSRYCGRHASCPVLVVPA
jgi:nucleotide-binding universal stress UspA family protein